MHETPADLATLQRLLDESYAGAGAHLAGIHTPERRLTADKLSAMLTGVRILALATVTAKGEPLTGPVDGLFYRGRFWFSSSPESVRFRHIRARPAVSATHTVGEELAVTVHGTALLVDPDEPANAGFKAYHRSVYPKWDQWFPQGGTAFAVIEPRRMFTFWMEHPPEASSG